MVVAVFFFALLSLANFNSGQFSIDPDCESVYEEINATVIENELIISIFKGLFAESKEQQLVDRGVLMQTARYMIEERDEYDPELVAFVRSLIVRPPPPGTKMNLNIKDRTDFSQFGQSKYIDELLGYKRNGFFVEAGGFDGEAHSNSICINLYIFNLYNIFNL
jgi:hypothetical protein